MSHDTDGLIGFMNHLNPYGHPSPTSGAPKNPQPYGRTSYYPPPAHQHSYHVSPPPPMGGPSPVPMMFLVSQPSTSSPSTSAYNLSSSGSASNSYTSYGSSPQKNPYFPFLVPHQSVAPPPGQLHASINFFQPSSIQHLQNFEKMNMENPSHLQNNSKKKWKNRNNKNPGSG
jgi:hypothetical protein